MVRSFEFFELTAILMEENEVADSLSKRGTAKGYVTLELISLNLGEEVMVTEAGGEMELDHPKDWVDKFLDFLQTGTVPEGEESPRFR